MENVQRTQNEGEYPQENEGGGISWLSLFVALTALVVIEAQIISVSLVLNVIMRQFVLPREIAYKRPFHLDYLEEYPVAVIPLVQEKYLTSGQLTEVPKASSVLIQDGSRFDIWLKLEMPLSQTNKPIFQVKVDLLTPNSTAVFSASKPALLQDPNVLLRQLKLLAFAPMYIFDLFKEAEVLYFPVIEKFQQSKAAKIAQLRIRVLRRKGYDPPELYSGEAHILIKLNIFQHFMYHYPAISLTLFTLFISGILNFGLISFVFIIFMILLLRQESSKAEVMGEKEQESELEPVQTSGASDVSTPIIDSDKSEKEKTGTESGDVDLSEDSLTNESESTSWDSTRINASSSNQSDSSDAGQDVVLKGSSKTFITEPRLRKG